MRPRSVARSSLLATLTSLTIVGASVAAAAPAWGAAAHPATTVSFTVNSAGDGADATADGICQTATAGECTLRAALQEANAATAPVTIGFAIAGAGVHTIAPASQLPALSNPNGITIDGFTQPGSSANTDPLVDNAVYAIELKGSGPTTFNGLVVTQSNNTIRGLDIHGFHVAIDINGYGTTANHNTVVGDMLGLTPTGGFDPTYGLSNAASCLVLENGASYNQIGAPGNATRNVISGCDFKGIASYNYPTSWNTIQNNIIGLDPTGTQRRQTVSHGIDITRGSEHTLIGGTGTQQGNLVSGNSQAGIEVAHEPSTKFNSVIGNLIGTDPTGNSAPAYAANGYWGVHLEGKGSCGTSPCPPDQNHETVEYNVIVGSGRGGVMVDKGTNNSLIAYNKIGVTANGTPAGNHLFGVNLNGGTFKITIASNEIANNDAGVQIQPDMVLAPNHVLTTTNQNTITQNSIHDNNLTGTPALGIDLTPFGKVNKPTNCSTYVNDCMIAPTLSNATPTSITATTCASCVVELFLADAAAGAWGSGKTYLGSATADGSTGVAQFYVPASARGQVVTATATNPNGSTSEFAQNVAIPLPTVGDVPPVAQVSASCLQLTCTFDGSASTDSDGTIVHYDWTFGDGATATGTKVSHTYATGGSYIAQLTVTDNGGQTGSAPSNNNVALGTGVVAYDAFDRTVAGGWGSADMGGAYKVNGTATDYSVGSGAGAMHIGTAATSHFTYLGGVSVLNSDTTVNVATDMAPAGGTRGQLAGITARRVAANTEYRVRVRFPVSGGVKLSIAKVVASTTEVQIGSEVTVAGLSYTPGQMYSVRFDVTGTNPTTLQAKVWVAGATEPASWNLTVADSEPTLQAPGAPGVRASLGASATNTPTWSFANLVVTNLG